MPMRIHVKSSVGGRAGFGKRSPAVIIWTKSFEWIFKKKKNRSDATSTGGWNSCQKKKGRSSEKKKLGKSRRLYIYIYTIQE